MILPCTKESVDIIADFAKEEPVIVPTDTLYGLAMSIYGDLKKIYLIKKRDTDKKLPVGVADMEMMQSIAEVDSRAEILVRNFMPGALTLILRSRIPEITGDTVGVRIPDHFIPIALMRKIGPLTLTSANKSGALNPVRVEDALDLNVKYAIDCGNLSGMPSTIVSLVDGIKLIRAGAIPFSAILNLLEE